MDWKKNIEYLEKYSFEFYPPVDIAILSKLKKHLNLELPSHLNELYSQTDGIGELLKTQENKEPILIGYLILKLEEVIQLNLDMRHNHDFLELYMPFDSLFFFSNAGNGDLFAYRILNNKIENHEIYCWNHETDERIKVANDLYSFVTMWIKGEIKI